MTGKQDQVAASVAGSTLKLATTEELFARLREAAGVVNNTMLSKAMGITQATVSKAKSKGQVPPGWVITVSNMFGVSADWLLYGIGPKYLGKDRDRELEALRAERNDLEGKLIEKTWDPERDFIVQVVGLEKCGTQGWEKIKRTPMFAPAPIDVHKADGFGVMVAGLSMKPEGVQPGFLLYCDPSVSPLEGDLIYLEDDQEHGAIKVFTGSTPRDGEEFLQVQAWEEPDEGSPEKPQKPCQMEIPRADIKRLATVVYVKRRV